MATNQRRHPKSFHFSSQYKSPFHRNEDRLSQIDFRTFDPFVPESRQTVANCKKHRRQRHELSDKCKHVLGVVDAQEKLLSTRPETQQLAGYSAQGATMRKPEISIEFGDDVPEIAKEYVKFWIEQSGMVKEPFSRQYDVHNLKDEHNHLEKPSVVLMTPFVDVDVTDENRSMALIRAFFEHPKEFAMKNKVGNLRIYSTNKKTHEEDAAGYLNHLPIKIVGKEMITKNLQKVVTDPTEEDEIEYLADEIKSSQEHYNEIEVEIKQVEDEINSAKDDKSRNELSGRKRRLDKEKNTWGNIYANNSKKLWEIKGTPDINERKRKIAELKQKIKEENKTRAQNKRDREYSTKQSKILRDMLSPENNIAPNRLGEGTNPIGYAMQAAETPFRATANILTQLVNRRMAQKEKRQEDEYHARLEDLATEEEELAGIKPPHFVPKKQDLDFLHGMGQTSPPSGPSSPPPGGKTSEPIIMGGEVGPESRIRTADIDEPPDSRVAGGVGDETIANEVRLPSNRRKNKEKPRTKVTSDIGYTINPKNKSEKYLNSSGLIIIAKLKQRGI
jgi:hypothetical protein